MIDTDTRIVVTGGTGFLGHHLMKEMKNNGYEPEAVGSEYNLVSQRQTAYMYERLRPEVVVHLAAVCGGIGANRKSPGKFFHDNMAMGLNVFEGAHHYGAKVVFLSTICAYPKITPVPFEEKNLWDGYPEETNAPYAIAKKSLMVMLEAYYKQYGMKSACVMPTNLYGPHDHFDLENSHVIPALINKFFGAVQDGTNEVICWGNGTPSRDFLYASDAARGIVKAMENMDKPTPINLGSGQEVTIRNLVELVAELCGYSGDIVWDASKPNGQPRRCLSNDRARDLLDWYPEISLRDGLTKTIEWYKEHKND